MKNMNGIEGLTGHAEGSKQAWGAVLTIGRKHPEKGFPTDTDKFFRQTTAKANHSFLYCPSCPHERRVELND